MTSRHVSWLELSVSNSIGYIQCVTQHASENIDTLFRRIAYYY
jgi:hypothetical protein